MLKIIAGEHKGQILKTVSGRNTRPTTGRLKESLFNILQSAIFDSTILDLFSGTGNLGLESLSRGSKNVVFVEKDKKALAVLRKNCRDLGYEDRTLILPLDVITAIRKLANDNKKFDIVFIDPPYNKDLETLTIEALSDANLLKDHGVIVVEHLFSDKQEPCINNFIRYDVRKYGTSAISFYRRDLDK